jgi:hypothetical protein
MEVLRDGTFVYNLNAEELSRGLRSSKRSPRNTKFLVECVGAVGMDKVLQVIEDLETDRVFTDTEILDTFPFPQIFVLTSMIIVCGKTEIFEYDGSTLTSKISALATGQLWSVVDFYEFVYMSNGVVSVLRDPMSGVYALTIVQPVAGAICDFNGQIIIGGLIV